MTNSRIKIENRISERKNFDPFGSKFLPHQQFLIYLRESYRLAYIVGDKNITIYYIN